MSAQSAHELVKSILRNPVRVVKGVLQHVDYAGVKGRIVFNNKGQGVVMTDSGEFVSFADANLPTHGPGHFFK